MADDKVKVQKVETESIPRKQATEEKQELKQAATKAAKTTRETKSGGGYDELDGVEKITPQQARQEMKEAVKKLKKDAK